MPWLGAALRWSAWRPRATRSSKKRSWSNPSDTRCVVYLGPVAPHWEVQSDYGPADVIDQFRERVLARLVLLPPHDPQFRRNSERVVRDAEREQLALEWVLDYDEAAEG